MENDRDQHDNMASDRRSSSSTAARSKTSARSRPIAALPSVAGTDGPAVNMDVAGQGRPAPAPPRRSGRAAVPVTVAVAVTAVTVATTAERELGHRTDNRDGRLLVTHGDLLRTNGTGGCTGCLERTGSHRFYTAFLGKIHPFGSQPDERTRSR